MPPEEPQVIVTTDTIGRKHGALLNSEPALETVKAKGAEATADPAQVMAKTAAVSSGAQQAKPNVQLGKTRAQADPQAAADAHQVAMPIMIDKADETATRAVAGSVGGQIGNRLIGGIPGGLYNGR
ncbi:MAG: hypothetical protein NVS3B5_14360 [Sphingomicrobium sp.]